MFTNGVLILIACVVLASVFSLRSAFRQYAFGVWIIVAFAAAMVYPSAFQTWWEYDPARLIVPLIQVIMFGMGTTLTPADFTRALRQPAPVIIGIGAQFAFMPVLGLMLGRIMGLEAEALAGVVLVGSVSGGVASNLMVYLAGGNVALSVTMTACSTIVSPLMTPLLMKALVGAIVPISFVDMMLSILNMIIAPILAGLLANRILYSDSPWARRPASLTAAAACAAAMGWVAWKMDWSPLARFSAIQPGCVVGAVLVAMATGSKLVSVATNSDGKWIDRVLPLVSMAGIWIIIAIITARSRDTLLSIGITLIVTAILHNSLGYLIGYWSGRLFRLSEVDCRTIAFEVGMQNSGMAAGLSIDTLKSASAALAPAIFGPWMNISGSLLASWWKRRPVDYTSRGPE